MLSYLFAALGLLVCIGMGVHMALPHRLQVRLEARWRVTLRRVSGAWTHALDHRKRQRVERAAGLEAQEAIQRARRAASAPSAAAPDGEQDPGWDGNVYRPKQFEKPRKPH